jgi:hypothetical protein
MVRQEHRGAMMRQRSQLPQQFRHRRGVGLLLAGQDRRQRVDDHPFQATSVGIFVARRMRRMTPDAPYDAI